MLAQPLHRVERVAQDEHHLVRRPVQQLPADVHRLGQNLEAPDHRGAEDRRGEVLLVQEGRLHRVVEDAEDPLGDKQHDVGEEILEPHGARNKILRVFVPPEARDALQQFALGGRRVIPRGRGGPRARRRRPRAGPRRLGARRRLGTRLARRLGAAPRGGGQARGGLHDGRGDVVAQRQPHLVPRGGGLAVVHGQNRQREEVARLKLHWHEAQDRAAADVAGDLLQALVEVLAAVELDALGELHEDVHQRGGVVDRRLDRALDRHPAVRLVQVLHGLQQQAERGVPVALVAEIGLGLPKIVSGAIAGRGRRTRLKDGADRAGRLVLAVPDLGALPVVMERDAVDLANLQVFRPDFIAQVGVLQLRLQAVNL